MKLKVFKNTLSKHYENYDSWMLNSEILSKTFAGESFGLLFFFTVLYVKYYVTNSQFALVPMLNFPIGVFFLL